MLLAEVREMESNLNQEANMNRTSWLRQDRARRKTLQAIPQHLCDLRDHERLVNQSATRIHLSDILNKPLPNRFGFHPRALSYHGREGSETYLRR